MNIFQIFALVKHFLGGLSDQSRVLAAEAALRLAFGFLHIFDDLGSEGFGCFRRLFDPTERPLRGPFQG